MEEAELPTSPHNSPAKEGVKQAAKATKKRGKGRSQKKEAAKPSKEKLIEVLSDCEGEFGPRTSSPDRGMQWANVVTFVLEPCVWWF